ncbi:MAG TPA: helix-turn-helix domain-containing protein [Actinotalea caeni]|uniref:TetR/AcrR family transcriptional regulator n=1 Tax=Actinotalea caeni TaxID=1348467 RepID=UPI002B4AFCC9|nr:helix-turn-helix domain-containing protein [Actinotalea caeni]HLV56348.1 helix-turn-helix domain-containing protein [Actinotalea caeni]
MLAAAAELFATRGYARTSLAQIADAAGVSTETVKANGPKSGLLIGAFDQAFTGSEQYVPIHQRELGAELMALPTERLLPGYVAFVAGANARIARLWSAFVGAAAGDDAVASELDALQERRRADFRASVALFRERGLARRDVDDAELAAALSFLVSPEGYLQLVDEAGWSMDRYQAWLVDAIERTILAP